jgi:hypothetical protein
MNTVPAGRGWNWVLTGFALFRKSPALWAFLTLSYIMLMQLLGLIPLLGWFAATVLIPVFSASFMIASRELDQGRRLRVDLLFSGFRANLPALLRQGGLYLASALAILGLSALIDGGDLLQLMVLGTKPPVEAYADGSLAAAAILAGALYLPMLAAFWFAPALSAWHDMPALQALFYSFFAAMRNWQAFVAYGLALALLSLICSFALFMLAWLVRGLLGDQSQGAFLLVILPVMLTYVPTLFASFYASYRDVFPEPEPAAEAAAHTQ